MEQERTRCEFCNLSIAADSRFLWSTQGKFSETQRTKRDK